MEIKDILAIDGSQAIETIGQLKEHIKELKQALDNTKAGSESYNAVLSELQKSKDALAGATRGYTGSIKDVNQNSQITISTYNSLVEEVKTLSQALADSESGQEEQVEIATALEEKLKELEQAEANLTTALSVNSKAEETNTDSTGKVVESYNALVHQMAELKSAWRATTDEAERADLAKQIDAINSQLKNLDASTGNFQRNVGDYANQMTKAFTATAGSAGTIINPLKGVKTGMDAISKTPMIAILGLIVNVVMKVVDALHSSEENMMALNEAMAAFEPIGDLLKNIMQALGKAVVWVVEKFGDLMEAIGLVGEASKERIEIAQLENQIEKETQENIVKRAKIESDVAELRAKAADKEKYTNQERAQFAKEAMDLDNQLMDMEQDLANKRLELAKKESELSGNSAEQNRKLREAEAETLRIKTDNSNKRRQLTRQMNEATKADREEERKAAQDRIRQAQEVLSAEKDLIDQQIALTKKGSEDLLALQMASAAKEYELKVSKAKNTITNQEQLNQTLLLLEQKYQQDLEKLKVDHDQQIVNEEILTMTNRMNLLRKGSYEQLAIAVEIKQKEIETLRQMEDESDASFEARRIALSKQLREAQEALVASTITEEQQNLQNAILEAQDGSLEQLEAKAELARYTLESLYQGIDESDEAYMARKLQSAQEFADALQAIEDKKRENDILGFENDMLMLEENSLAYLEMAVSLKKYELDTLHQMENESQAQFFNRQLKAEKAYNNSKKQLTQARVQMTTNAVAAVGNLLNSLASIYESDTDASEEELQKAKNLKIAGAVMSTISGAIEAYMSCQSYPQPFGAIFGAIQAAIVTATGIAQINQLRSQEVSKNSSGGTTPKAASSSAPALPSSASVNSPQLEQTISRVQNITTASDEDRINQSQKVYLVTDELEMAQSSKKVQYQESTF